MQFEFLNTVRLSKYSRVLGASFHCCLAVNNKNKQLLKLFAENRYFQHHNNLPVTPCACPLTLAGATLIHVMPFNVIDGFWY
jgi:succinylarginine dihydrolase